LVLDAGCGPGRFTYILSTFKPKKIYGIDLDKNNIRIAKKIFKNKNIKFSQGDALKIPHKNNTFDFVYSSGVVHHTQNMEKGIDELFRVCKDGGNIYLYAYGQGGLYWKARKIMNKLMKMIPQKFSQIVLNLMNMPNNRLFILDNWYVSHEDHSSEKNLIKILKQYKPKKIQKIVSSVKYDYQSAIKKYDKYGKLIWGDGDLRYLIKK
jgi:ubiquinone/menaquinone biosynthesis C-methylase UbiE